MNKLSVKLSLCGEVFDKGENMTEIEKIERIKEILLNDIELVTYDMYREIESQNNYEVWDNDKEEMTRYLIHMANENLAQMVAMVRDKEAFNLDDAYWKLDGYGNIITRSNIMPYDELDDDGLLDELAEEILNGDISVDSKEIDEIIYN